MRSIYRVLFLAILFFSPKVYCDGILSDLAITEQQALSENKTKILFKSGAFKEITSKYERLTELSAESSFRLIPKEHFDSYDKARKSSSITTEVELVSDSVKVGLATYLSISFLFLTLLLSYLVRSQFYNNLNISKKLGSGFTYMICVALMIALVGIFSLSNVSNQADMSSKIASLSSLASEFEALQYRYVISSNEDEDQAINVFNLYEKTRTNFKKSIVNIEKSKIDAMEVKFLVRLKHQLEEYAKSFLGIKNSSEDIKLLKNSLLIIGEEIKEVFAALIEIHEIELENLEFAETPDKEVIYLQTLLVEDLFRAETWLLKIKLQDSRFLIDKSYFRIEKLSIVISELVERLNQLENTIYKSQNIQEVRDESAQKLQEIRDKFILYVNGMRSLIHETYNSDVKLNEGTNALRNVLDLSETFATRAEKERYNVQKESSIAAILLVVIALLGGIFCSSSITKSLKSPIEQVLKYFESVLKGDVSSRVELNRSDELGKMIDSLNLMADFLQDHAKMTESISKGYLDNQVKVLSDKDVFGKSLERMQNTLYQLVNNISDCAESVESGAGIISRDCDHLSTGVESLSSSLEQINASMDMVAQHINENEKNAMNANEMTSRACEAASHGSKQMQTLVEAINDINDAASSITKIIRTIEDIAFQTNLLALNAAVEAARAGAHGRGFAVVAEEVRNLAGRSAKAVTETAELISLSNDKIIRGTNIANETALSLDKIVEDIISSAGLVSEIAEVSTKQSESIQDANLALSEVSKVTDENSNNVKDTAAQSKQLISEVSGLVELLDYFSVKTETIEQQANEEPKLLSIES
ncbi:MAG: HAMP domain-containing protein [Candidatus Cloacimonetes bacterium]|nr:HAMP domain-containing protein [Candidatus Cloacimonadota bacterium]